MHTSIKAKTITGLFWAFHERCGQQGIQLAVTVVLGRLLLPEQFGLVGMLLFFIAIAESLVDSGFGLALIQKQDSNHVDECSVFYFNIVVGCVIGGLLWLGAPAIAAFYNQPMLMPIARVLSINPVISAFGLVQTVLLVKSIDFKTLLKASVTATLVSALLSIVLAMNGYGVWSLVAHYLCSNLFRTILLWLLTSWRPFWVFSLQSLRSMFAYGSRLLLLGLFTTAFDNIYLLVIGRLFSPAQTGFYSQAKRLQEAAPKNVSAILNNVTFPALATLQNDSSALKSAVEKALILVAFINCPLMMALLLLARIGIQLLLTDKWAPTIPYFQLLCVAGLLYPISVVHSNVFKATGRSGLLLRLDSAKKALILMSIMATHTWGIAAMLWGHIAVSGIGYLLTSYYMGRMLRYPMLSQARAVLPYLLTSLVAAAIVAGLEHMPFHSDALLILLCIATGGAVYCAFNWMCRTAAWIEMVGILAPRLFPRGITGPA